jgi:hypothetical protein
MSDVDPLVALVAAIALCGLAAVVWEIASKRPGIFFEIMTDVRRFAEPSSAEATPAPAEEPAAEPTAEPKAPDETRIAA